MRFFLFLLIFHTELHVIPYSQTALISHSLHTLRLQNNKIIFFMTVFYLKKKKKTGENTFLRVRRQRDFQEAS